jgi:hypothetical protein
VYYALSALAPRLLICFIITILCVHFIFDCTSAGFYLKETEFYLNKFPPPGRVSCQSVYP